MIYDNLSPRQKEVLDLICEGFSNEEIAKRLFISAFTVNSYVTILYAKYSIFGTNGVQRVKLVLKRLEEKTESD